eukprot:jgi/Hompol1/453/HPOL_004734-RA
MELHTFTTQDALSGFIEVHIDQFMKQSHGESKVFEMVNLALIGQAISNIHDGDIDLGGSTILKGIKSQSQIGQLSLFEHYNNIR